MIEYGPTREPGVSRNVEIIPTAHEGPLGLSDSKSMLYSQTVVHPER
jgi:hypothetical protein